MSNRFSFKGFVVREFKDFPSCCGAATLAGFGIPVPSELCEEVVKEFTLFCDAETDMRGLIAVLSAEETDELWFKLLEKAGFVRLHRYKNYYTGNTLEVWFRDPPEAEPEEFDDDY